MATRYWTGTGTWTTTNTANWGAVSGGTGATVPTTADSVVFDNNSVSCVLSAAALQCSSLSSQSFSGTMSGTGGTLSVSAGGFFFNGSFTFSGNTNFTFNFTSVNNTVDFGYHPIAGNITFAGAAGVTINMGSDTTCTGVVTLESATLALGAFNFTARRFVSIGAVLRSLTAGIGGMTLNPTAGDIVWDTSTTNLTIPGRVDITVNTGVGSYSINNSTTAIASVFFSTPSAISSACLRVVNTGGASTTVTASGAFGELNLTGLDCTFAHGLSSSVTTTYVVPATGGTYATTDALTLNATTIDTNGRTLFFPIFILGAGVHTLASDLTTTAALSFTQGTLAVGTQTVTALTFSSTGATSRSITNSLGAKFVLNGTGAATLWNTSGTGISIPSSLDLRIEALNPTLGTSTRTFSFPQLFDITSEAVAAPTTTGFILSSVSTASISISTGSTVRNLDLTGFSGTWANTACFIAGNITIPETGGTYTAGAAAWTLNGAAGTTQNLDLPSRSTRNITINATATTDIRLTNTTGSNLGAFVLTLGRFYVDACPTIELTSFTSSGSGVRTLDITNATVNIRSTTATVWATGVTNLTEVTDNSTVAFIQTVAAWTHTIDPGGFVFNNIDCSSATALGIYTFSSVFTCQTLTNSNERIRLNLPVGTCDISNFAVSGRGISLQTVVEGAGGTMNRPNGGAQTGINFLTITSSNVTPANSWYAGLNSNPGTGNTGWIFNNNPSQGALNFFP